MPDRASASDAIVIGFTIGAETSAERLADRLGVEIRHYNIIYQLIDDIELALHGMLEPVFTDVVVGKAEVREIFSSRRGVQIAGCRVTEGHINRGSDVRVSRDGAVRHESTITTTSVKTGSSIPCSKPTSREAWRRCAALWRSWPTEISRSEYCTPGSAP